MKNENMLVRIIDVNDENEFPIKSYTTSNLSETLKLYSALKDSEDINIALADKYDIKDKFYGKEATLKDIVLNFADDTSGKMLSLDLYVEVF